MTSKPDNAIDNSKRKLRILMLCEFYAPEIEFQENILVRYYCRDGHTVRMLTSTYDDVFNFYAEKHDKTRPESSFIDHGGEICRLRYKYNILNRLRPLAGVDKHLEQFEPDLIFAHSVTLNFPEIVRYMKAHPKCRLIMDYHSDYGNAGVNWASLHILHGVIRKYYYDIAKPYISKVFPIVPAGFKFLRDIYKIPDADMELLPLGADLDQIKRVTADLDKRKVRADLGISDQELMIITGGKIVPRKCLHMLIEAISDPALAGVKVVILGDFSQEFPEYKEKVLAAVEKVKSQVIFPGWQSTDQLTEKMSAADLAVFPARQSIMWQQSIACGLPMLCGNVAEQDTTYLNRHQNCIILKADDISSANLRKHLIDLSQHREKLTEMSAGAHRTAAEVLDWNQLMKQTLRFCYE